VAGKETLFGMSSYSKLHFLDSSRSSFPSILYSLLTAALQSLLASAIGNVTSNANKMTGQSFHVAGAMNRIVSRIRTIVCKIKRGKRVMKNPLYRGTSNNIRTDHRDAEMHRADPVRKHAD
jgi:hypothetical protein